LKIFGRIFSSKFYRIFGREILPTLVKIKDSKKVAIYSANLIEVDWEERTQARFILDG